MPYSKMLFDADASNSISRVISGSIQTRHLCCIMFISDRPVIRHRHLAQRVPPNSSLATSFAT